FAPPLVRSMIEAADQTGVGPMAAVAGAVAEFVGLEFAGRSPDLIIENGGDTFILSRKDLIVGIFAGESPLSHRLGIKIQADRTPLGVCTSSATVGHSLSLGRADAACVIASSPALADAAATALGNRIAGRNDVRTALDWALTIDGVQAALIIMGDQIGAKGDIELESIG
ncbi:MAG: UPF0280 family protein, partial [Deltaproteobacteria bacterium]|nr:UPF0280 family protein [Deltaproteobacteria bacterium]